MKNRIGLVVLVVALAAFELFNFDSTRYSLNVIFGGMTVFGFTWAGALALAFGGIDFAGLARIFTPEKEFKKEPKFVKYLFGAWLFASIFNAILTWFGAANMVSGRSEIGNESISHTEVVFWAPLLIALMVWITRLLLIGTLSSALDQKDVSAPKKKSVRKGSSLAGALRSVGKSNSSVGKSNSSAMPFRAPNSSANSSVSSPNSPNSPNFFSWDEELSLDPQYSVKRKAGGRHGSR